MNKSIKPQHLQTKLPLAKKGGQSLQSPICSIYIKNVYEQEPPQIKTSADKTPTNKQTYRLKL